MARTTWQHTMEVDLTWKGMRSTNGCGGQQTNNYEKFFSLCLQHFLFRVLTVISKNTAVGWFIQARVASCFSRRVSFRDAAELVRHCEVHQLGFFSTTLGRIRSWDRAEVVQNAHGYLQTFWLLIQHLQTIAVLHGKFTLEYANNREDSYPIQDHLGLKLWLTKSGSNWTRSVLLMAIHGVSPTASPWDHQHIQCLFDANFSTYNTVLEEEILLMIFRRANPSYSVLAAS